MTTSLIIEEFPLIAAAVTKAKARYQQNSLSSLLEVLNQYSESIPNPVFKDAKHSLNTAVDVVRDFDGLYGESFRAAYRYEGAALDFMYANGAAGKVKLATKRRFQNPTWFAVCAEIVKLHEALESLKSGIVKRQIRPEEERAEDYVPPIPTTAAATITHKILKEMTDPLTIRYEEVLYNAFVADVEYRMDHPRVRGERYIPGLADMLLSSIGNEFDNFTGNYKSLKPIWKSILRDKAKNDADFAQRMFLYKNVLKLATIIENKGNYTGYKINSGHVHNAGFSGEIVFNFADGATFVVRNKVVAKYSVNNRAFHQFPTTFHYAYLPNGNRMPGQPSEQDMIEVFGKG